MKKYKAVDFLVIFFVGGLSGVFFTFFVVPKLAEFGVKTAQKAVNQTIIVNKTEKLFVQEEEILDNIIEEAKKYTVYVKSKSGNLFLSSGSGVIIGSNGLIVTRKEAINAEAEIVVERNGNELEAEVIKEGNGNGLVLLKVNDKESNFPVISFSSPKVGKKVFMLGRKRGTAEDKFFINKGIIKIIDDGILETNIVENAGLISGTPLIDYSGNLVGINFIGLDGFVFSVSSDIIKEFAF